MVSIEKIRTLNASGLASIPETRADMILILDRDVTVVNGTLPFPASPIDGQFYILISKCQVTNFTTDTAGKGISFTPTTLLANEIVGWIFDEAANSWFCYTTMPRWGAIGGTLSGQSDLQTALNAKLSSSGNGSSLTGLTKTQVGLSNVDNTSDANKPVSTAQQTALDAKLATNGNGSSLTGLTKTQVGLANVDNTSDASKPVSTAQQTALNLKANLASPDFTGTPTGIGLPVFARVTGSNATTTGQALTNITGLSVPLIANAVYEFEAVMSCSVSAVTTGISYGVQFSTAGASVEANIVGASSTVATKAERINTLNSATTAFLATSAQAGGVNIRGVLATGANAGNLTIQHLKITSGTSTVFINSFLKVTRIQ